MIAFFLVVGVISYVGDHNESSGSIESAKEYKAPTYDSYSPSTSNYLSGYSASSEDNDSQVSHTIDRDTVISEHWDEIKEHVNGIENIEACTGSNCYDLAADISNGIINIVHFPNIGYLSPDEDINENGSASSYHDGKNWDYQVDMDSGTVDDTVQEWADDNGYEVQ